MTLSAQAAASLWWASCLLPLTQFWMRRPLKSLNHEQTGYLFTRSCRFFVEIKAVSLQWANTPTVWPSTKAIAAGTPTHNPIGALECWRYNPVQLVLVRP